MFFARVDKYNFFGNTITGVLKLACTQKLLAREIFKVGAREFFKKITTAMKNSLQNFRKKITTLAMIFTTILTENTLKNHYCNM